MTSTPAPPQPAAARDAARRRVRPATRARITGDVAVALAGLLLGALLGATLLAEPASTWTSATGWFIALGALAAVAGTFGVLVLLVLIARLPPLERTIGQQRLVGWHRRLAPWALGLVGVHVYLSTLGYALAARTQPLTQLWGLITTAPWVLPAAGGLVLLVVAAVTSWRVARRRLPYQAWWTVHLLTYVAVAAAFAHQIALGGPFVADTWARTLWIGLYLAVAAALLVFRLGLPVYRSLRHDLRVAAVVPEGPGVVSVWLRGRALDRLPAQPGQYLTFRFVAAGLCWEGHPYSLSAPLRDDHLRITVKALGDGSTALTRAQPGTRVLIEGPYGVLTPRNVTSDRVVLVGAGIGITPLRALLEQLPPETRVDVLFRARTAPELVLRPELDALAAVRPATRVHYLLGGRHDHPMTAPYLRRVVPDIATAEAVVCGTSGFAAAVTRGLLDSGVPAERVHVEPFDDLITEEVPA